MKDQNMGIDLVLLMILWILAVVCVTAIGSPNTLIWTSKGNNAIDSNQDLLLPDDLKSIYRIHFILKTKSDNVYFADDLNKYGCWCAQNGTSYPVDELDRCCLEHQMCLKEILSKGCPLSSRYYSYEQCFGLIFKCTDSDECKQKLCTCDIEAANCLSNKKLLYNQRWKKGNKDYCIKT